MKIIFTLLTLTTMCISTLAQTIDTLGLQDFELVPAVPTWNFTGPVVYNSGNNLATALPPNSPIGINSSRAWETTTQSGGLVLEFDNVIIPAGYDSVYFEFRLAALRLTTGTTGGPDHLDYVLVEYSTDNGNNWFGRLRIRGAAANNGHWGYNATGVGKVYYQPTPEVMFQPANTGLATTDGYSTNGITFPGNVTQVKIRMTGRSSSASDTWMVDNVLLTGFKLLPTNIEKMGQFNLAIYPNPAADVLHIRSTKEITNVNIHDVTGQLVISKKVTQNKVFISELAKGIYFIQIKENRQTITKKFIKG